MYRFAGRFSFVQDRMHLLADRHFDPRAFASPTAALVVSTPSATMPCMPAMIVSQFAPLPELHADAAVARQSAGAGQHQVAEPGKSRHGLALSAASHRQARDFRQPARDECRHGIVAQSESVAHPGGNGNHVLQRAAQLHPATSSLRYRRGSGGR